MSRYILPVLVALGLLLGAALIAPQPSEARVSADPWQVCEPLIDEAEQALGLPPRLLQAISKAESGRYNKEREAILAWPWTVMAEGKGRYLPSKAAAIAEVRQLQAKGVTNIDVGCMQVNLRWHGENFDNLELAFDPAYNVAYAATLLAQLKQANRSWTKAVGRYHSATPKYSGRYRSKVFKIWSEEKSRQRKEEVAARRALNEARLEAASKVGEKVAPGAIGSLAFSTTPLYDGAGDKN